MIQEIVDNGRILAIIIRASFKKEGIHFCTPPTFSQQLAYMRHPEGHLIPPHVHNAVVREVEYTKEVLYIKSGRVRVDFYTEDRVYLKSTVLNTGDVVLLAYGGHGFRMLAESEIVEVKQGPYAGDRDKTRFEGVLDEAVRIDEVRDDSGQ